MRFENGRGKAFEGSFDEEYVLCTILAALHTVFELCKRELRDKKTDRMSFISVGFKGDTDIFFKLS